MENYKTQRSLCKIELRKTKKNYILMVSTQKKSSCRDQLSHPSTKSREKKEKMIIPAGGKKI